VSHGEDDRYEELIKKKVRAERTRFGHIDDFRPWVHEEPLKRR